MHRSPLEIVCRVCGQTNIRYEGGWRGFWLRPRQAHLCTFCRAMLDDGKFSWFQWPERVVMVLIFYGGYALVFAGIWMLVLTLVLMLLGRIEPVSKLDQVLRIISFVVAGGLGLWVCESRRRKGKLLE